MYITIYGKPQCTFCEQAKNLLDARSIPYDYKELDVDFVREDLMALAPTARSYPVIFINGENIGGFAQLQAAILREMAVGYPSTQQMLTE